MSDPTNKERGYRVITLLDAYCETVEAEEESEETLITDFIADLLHLAHQRGYNAGEIAAQALNHFENEISEEA